MSHVRLSLLVVSAALMAFACSGPPGGTVAPPGSPATSQSPSVSPTPTTGAIDHPTGATDIVLRFEEGGGFVMPAFQVTQAPIFTLYGDGTIVFRPLPPDAPSEAEDGIFREVPFKTARLTEDQVQQLLDFAITEGGLGLASKDLYDNPMVADASTATFTIRAGGLEKTFGVYGLGIDAPGVPDGALRASFFKLAERLRSLDQGGAFPAADYAPERFRGVLLDGAGFQGVAPISWPWPDIEVSDFGMPGDEQGPAFPTRVMSAEEIAATGVTDGAGGFQNLLVKAPDGKVYAFAARPLLPDEAS